MGLFTGSFQDNTNNLTREEFMNKSHMGNQAGSDNMETYTDEYVLFNYDNASITDEHREPVSYNGESLTIIFDGEIYNYVELRESLYRKGYKFTSEANPEMIAALFDTYKEDAFKHIRGKFSLIVWDKKNTTLYGARDIFGVKPLFYRKTEDGIIFGSAKKNVAFTMKDTKINTDALQHYLSFQFVPEPMTMTADIKKVEPGHFFVKKPGQPIVFKKYWQANFNPILTEKSTFIKRIRDVLYDSVSIHMRGEKPVGSLLSGGIDSTFIVSLAKQINPSIKTFSVGFEREGFSEVDVAKETADKLDVENISYIVSPEEYVENLPKIMWALQDPLADPACVPLYFVAREARKHVGAVLSGEGADELFGGYNIYREPHSLRMFNSIPKPVHFMLGKIAKVLPEGVRGKSFLERGTIPLRDRYIGNAKMFEEEEKTHILKSYNNSLSYQQITAHLFDEVADYPLVNQMQYVDIHTWLRGDIMLKANQMTKANSLEVRSPFLDKDVFQVASEIPVDLKIANGTTKQILREASKGIIPDHVLNRRKLGFPVPIRHWLKNELNGWAKQLINESQTGHLLYKSYISDLLDAHCQGKGDYSRKIWTILMFMLWHQVFIEDKFDFANLNSLGSNSVDMTSL